MARRLIGLAAIAAAAVVSASGSFASSTPTRHFYRVSWNVPVAVNGRHPLSMRVSWLLLSRTTWSVRVQVVNRSDHTLRPIRNGKTGWGLVWAKSYPYERHQQCSPPTCGL